MTDIRSQVNLTAGNKVIGAVCYWNDCDCLFVKFTIADTSYGLIQTSLNISTSLGKLCADSKCKKNCCGSYSKIYNQPLNKPEKQCTTNCCAIQNCKPTAQQCNIIGKCSTKKQKKCNNNKCNISKSSNNSSCPAPPCKCKKQKSHKSSCSSSKKSSTASSCTTASSGSSCSSYTTCSGTTASSCSTATSSSCSTMTSSCSCPTMSSCSCPTIDNASSCSCPTIMSCVVPPEKKCIPVQKPIEFMECHDNIMCYQYRIPNCWCKGTKLYIVARAKVTELSNKQTLTITSQIGDNVRGPISTNPFTTSSNNQLNPSTKWGPFKAAVQAKNWYANPNNPILPGQSIGSVAHQWNVGRTPPDIPGVTWISTAQNTEQWWIQTWRRFNKSFNLCNGYPIAGTITINADDQYNLFINNIFIVSYANIFGSLQTYTFKPKVGQNLLDIVTLNIAAGVEGNLTDQLLNPNGLTYSLSVDYYPIREAVAVGVKESCGSACGRAYFTVVIC